MCNSVACRLGREGYVANMLYWISRLGRDTFTTFIRKNAAVIEKASNNPRLEEWQARLGNKFQTFMNEGIGEHIIDDMMNRAMIEWFERLEIDHFCSIFGNGSVMARVIRKGKLQQLLDLYNDGHANKSMTLFKTLSERKWKGVKDFFM